MPRAPRVHGAGIIHHVVFRGVEGREIFSGDSDFEDYVTRFEILVRELDFVVLAWCLLRNHGHHVLQSGRVPLSVLMARLGARHAQRFNRRRGRAGHLFQARYKAVVIEEDGHLARTIPYVLGNSARHGLTSPAGALRYRWSMLSALAGNRPARAFEASGPVSGALGDDAHRLPSLATHTAMTAGGAGARLEPDQIEELERLVADCCVRHGLDRAALRSRSPAARDLRAELCSRAAESLDVSFAEIARHTGIPYDTVWRLGRSPH